MHDENVTSLDYKEKELLETLTKKYEKFVQPNFLQARIIKTKDKVSKYLPEKIKGVTADAIKSASDLVVIKKVIESAGKGFGVVNENSARYTLSKKQTIKSLSNKDIQVIQFENICELRSYYIEKNTINRRKAFDLPTTFVGGGVTGFFGLWGVPFNLAYTFFMYYRTVQAVGLHYGYDVIEDPRELEFASSVTIECLSPHITSDAQNLGSIVSRMMFATNVTALKESLMKLSYEQMAQKGGAELLYVQIRALANAQAKKALEKVGKEGVEAGIFKNLLEQIGKKMSKETGKKAVPIIGGAVGALSDTYTMNRIIEGANLIYHKRFLFEKDIRIRELTSDLNDNLRPQILDYDEIMSKVRPQ